ncbi:MAG: sigma-70 family RNA polymerase sigma factor [Deltaproteobacteria bacterium]|nr:sigma-70 family RNA polymerase sigma factor [Deltaproteobacteria bacterium]
MPIPHDKQLMEATARGDLEAFGEIVLRHQRFVWGIAYRFFGDKSAAEDLAQETFIRILQAAPRYKPSADFRAYLYRIVSRLCIDKARVKRPILMDTLPEMVDDSPTPAAVLLARERETTIRQALDNLPPRQRLAVILKYYEGLPYADIAQTLGITVKAVERLLGRARAALRSALRRQEI